MNINLVRTANIALTATILFAGQCNYLWYIGMMQLSLEILNHRRLYLLHSYKVYNFIFWAYELILLERLRTSHLPVKTEWLINCAEHLGFGIIICLKVYVYTAVFGKEKKLSRWQRGLFAFVIFNIIGVVNELFQNSLSNRSLLIFIPDSRKDVTMNLLGACVFMIAVLWRMCRVKRNTALVK